MNHILWILKLVLVFLTSSAYVYILLVLYTKLQIKKQNLKNKVVVITGASSGIGEALAHSFQNEGCRVVLAARRVPELMRVKKDLMAKNPPPHGLEPVVLKLDLNNHKECELFPFKVEEECGPIDILVNNGAITSRGPHLDSDMEIHKRVMDVNYFGTVSLTNSVARKMVQRQSGHIVMVGSVLGRMAVPFRGPYSASKHALIAYTDSLRAELQQHNISVSMILPGYVRTRISAKALDAATGKEFGKLEKDSVTGFPPEEIAERLVNMVKNKEIEVVICQWRLSIGMFLRRNLPSVYFYLTSRIRE